VAKEITTNPFVKLQTKTNHDDDEDDAFIPPTLIRLPLMVLVFFCSLLALLLLYFSPFCLALTALGSSTLRAVASCCWSVLTNYMVAHWTRSTLRLRHRLRLRLWLLLSLCTQKSRWKALAACHLPGQTFILLNLASQQGQQQWPRKQASNRQTAFIPSFSWPSRDIHQFVKRSRAKKRN